MIILPSTTDKLQLITSSAATIDVVCSYGEVDQATPPVVQPFGRQATAISSATTTDILAAPASSKTRTPEEITICNKHASLACDVTPLYNANSTLYTIGKWTLNPGEMLEYMRGIGWFRIASAGVPPVSFSTADQTTASGTDTYVAGSAIVIPNSRPLAIGTVLRWRVVGTKTAAGAAAWTVNVRFGTNGSTADTARLAFAQVTDVQTAAADAGVWDIECIVRGPIGASCIVAGGLSFKHHLAVTGFSTVGNADVYQITSSAFDCTTSGMIVGLSIAPNTSGVFTFQAATGQVLNI